MGTESQGHAGFDNAMVMLMIMLKQEEKPENIGMRTVMTTMTSYCQFFSFQRCGTMGTESQGYVGSDNDCTDDAEELEQKPERFKIRSKMTLMAWIKIFFFFSFPSLQWYGTHGSRKPRRWQTLTMTAVVMTKSMLKQEQAREQLQENDNIVLFLPVMWSR